jgi:hypothetical protein
VKVALALVSFIDGSYLYVELSKKIEPADASLYCERIVGLPDGMPADKPTIAVAIQRMATAGESLEVIIPMSRINGINIQEEFLGKQVASDIEALWKGK